MSGRWQEVTSQATSAPDVCGEMQLGDQLQYACIPPTSGV